MINHIILTVSDVERSLAFYDAALRPLNIRFFLPYKGEHGHADLWGIGDGKRAFFWLKQGKPDPGSIHWGFDAESNAQVDEFYQAAIAVGATTTYHRGHDWSTIQDITQPMYWIPTGTRSK